MRLVSKPVEGDREMATDAELVRATQAGQPASFEQLVRRHHARVYAIAYVRLRDRDAADDVAQEAFLRAYLCLDRLADPKRFAAWLSTIARNLASDWNRRGMLIKDRVQIVDGPDSALNAAAARECDGGTAMEAKEQNEALRDALLKLPPEQGEIIFLHYHENIAVREIARQLGMNAMRVRRQLKRALKAMRRGLHAKIGQDVRSMAPSPRSVSGTVALIAAAASMSGEARAAALAGSGAEMWMQGVNASLAAAKTATLAVAAKVVVGVALAAAVSVGVSIVTARHDAGPPGVTRPARIVERQRVAEPAARDVPKVARPVVEPAAEPAPVARPVLLADASGARDAEPAVAPAAQAPVEQSAPAEGAVEIVDLSRARTLRFPADRSVGLLRIREHKYRKIQSDEDWSNYGEASGLVTVPASTDVSLFVGPHGASDMAWLEGMRPGDVQELWFFGVEVPSAEWRHLSKVRKLDRLWITVPMHDDDLAFLDTMQAPRDITLPDSITDAGMPHLHNLTDLESLELRGSGRVTNVTNEGLECLAGLRHLRCLYIAGARVGGSEDGLPVLERLPALEVLGLNGTRVDDPDMKSISRLPNLKWLDLEETRVDNQGLACLARTKSLETLLLSRTRVTDAGLAHLRGLTSLKDLNLRSLNAGDAGMQHLSGLTSLEALTPPDHTTDAGLAAIGGMTNLKRLALQSTRATGAGLAHVKGLKDLCLELPCEVTDADLEKVAQIEGLTGLWLQHSPAVTDAGLAQLKSLTSLREVLLSGLKVSREAYSVLQAWPELHILHLRPAKELGRAQDGTSWLKYVEGLPDLAVLSLDDTDVTDDDLKSLRTLPALRRLNLSETSVTDAGLVRLKECRLLDWLDIQSTRITEAGLAQLPGVTAYMSGKGHVRSSSGTSESFWQEYTRRFIETYRLDVSQQQTAHAILRQMYDEATRYRQSHRDRIARLEAGLAGAGNPTTSRPDQEVRTLVREREAIDRPIQVDMLNRLKERLDRIPTANQRRAASP
jgi:RNA polymerase sigma factor (sigma-70 family)